MATGRPFPPRAGAAWPARSPADDTPNGGGARPPAGPDPSEPEQDKSGPEQADREGGIGAMSYDTVGDLPGGGGDTGRNTLGAGLTAGTASDGARSGSGAEPLGLGGADAEAVAEDFRIDGVSDLKGRPGTDPDLGARPYDRKDAPGRFGRPPVDPAALPGPLPGRVDGTGAAALPGGEDLPGDVARDAAGERILDGGAVGRPDADRTSGDGRKHPIDAAATRGTGTGRTG